MVEAAFKDSDSRPNLQAAVFIQWYHAPLGWEGFVEGRYMGYVPSFAGTLALGAGLASVVGAVFTLPAFAQGDGTFRSPLKLQASGAVAAGHFNADGRLDLAVVDGTGNVTVLLQDPVDAILILNRLFLGGDPVPCEDGADADDDGELGLSDPIRILSRLFLGGEALPPPSEACGEDPAADGLRECPAGC